MAEATASQLQDGSFLLLKTTVPVCVPRYRVFGALHDRT